jgi:dipeptide/tripeptide permease
MLGSRAAGLAVVSANWVGWMGAMLLAAIGAVATLFFFAVCPRRY